MISVVGIFMVVLSLLYWLCLMVICMVLVMFSGRVLFLFFYRCGVVSGLLVLYSLWVL